MLNRRAKITPAPDPKALFYRRTRKDGRKEVAILQDLSIDEASESWRGRFLVPGLAPYYMDQTHNELAQWEPILALTEEDLTGLVDKVAQRVVELLGQKSASPVEIVTAGMAVTATKSVDEAVKVATEITAPPDSYACSDCGKTYRYEKSYQKHIDTAHKS